MWKRYKAKRLIRRLSTGSIRENTDLVDKIRMIGTPAVKPLIEGLKSRQYRVKLECIRALGHIGDPRAVPNLERLLRHKNEIVREYATNALRKISKRAMIQVDFDIPSSPQAASLP